MLPIFCKNVLKAGPETGNILAGSNSGELVGAFVIGVLGHKISNFMWISRLNGVLYGLHWVFVIFSYYWDTSV